MNAQSTTAEIEYSCSYNNGFYLTTDLLLSGRGIKMNGDGSSHLRGKKTYHATETAFEKLKSKFETSYKEK